MQVLVIDNYDSFTYNLVHYIGELGGDGRCASERQDHRRRGSGNEPGGYRHFARPLHPE